MQSRIMELASQREFYIATNTRLRQTLAENDVSRLPNGVQPPPDGIQSSPRNESMSSTPVSSLTDGLAVGPGTALAQVNPPVVSSSLPKAAQDSLLHAHFLTSSFHYPYTSSFLHPSSTASLPHERGAWPSQLSSSRSPETVPSGATRHLQTDGLRNAHPLSSEAPERPSVHDVTQVTSTIQAPITAHTPLPHYGLHTVAMETQLHPRLGTHGSSSRSTKETR